MGSHLRPCPLRAFFIGRLSNPGKGPVVVPTFGSTETFPNPADAAQLAMRSSVSVFKKSWRCCRPTYDRTGKIARAVHERTRCPTIRLTTRGVQDQPHLIGERAAAAGAIGGKLGLVQFDQI